VQTLTIKPESAYDLRKSGLGRDDGLAGLIGPEFLSRAIAGLQPPAAVTHIPTVDRRGEAHS